MGWVLSLLTGPIVSAALSLGDKFLSAYLKAKDVDLEKFKALTEGQKETALAGIGYETAKLQAEQNIILAAMTHRIWWWAWALFVFPIGGYQFAIYFVSIFDALLNTPGCFFPQHGQPIKVGVQLCEWYVTRVPPEQEAWARLIIPTIFALQTGSGVVAGIVKGFGKR